MEENNFEFNNNENVTSEPVAPEAPVEPAAPSEPVTPVDEAPAAPAEPAQPVAPEAPSEPVMPVEPSATTQIPVQPQPAPVQPTAPAEPPKKGGFGIVFGIIVAILVILIIGLVVVLVVLGLNKNGKNDTTTTTAATTEATTAELTTSTSRYSVTTAATTTTYAVTTKAPDSPTPTSVDGDTIKIGSLSAKIPTGYTIYSSGSQPVILNNTKKVQIQFGYTNTMTFEEIYANPSRLYSEFQEMGYSVVDAAYGEFNGKDYILLSLSYSGLPTGYGVIYGITAMGSGTLQFSALFDINKTQANEVIADADFVITQAKNSGSSFAPGDIKESAISSKSIDNFDTRLFN